MGILANLWGALKTELAPEAQKDEAAVLQWLQDKNISAVDAAIAVAEHSLPNDSIAEKLVHGALIKGLDNSKALIEDDLEGFESHAYTVLLSILTGK